MKLQYLGTAASEGVPAIFCDCQVCRKSILAGGRNIRTRSQAMVDDRILIDFPADTYYHFLQYGVPASKIHTCIITHNHSDHLYPMEIANRQIGYVTLQDEQPLTFYATEPAYNELMKVIDHAHMGAQNRVVVKQIQPFQAFEAEGYRITPLKADHDKKCEPVIFSIEKNGEAILYANDTGMFPEETWEYLRQQPVKYDIVSLDCTETMTDCDRGHMGLSANAIVRNKLKEYGIVKENTRFILQHFSHTGQVTYDELVPIASKDGFEVSYDGMTVITTNVR